MIPEYERPPSRWPEPLAWAPCSVCKRRAHHLYHCEDGALRCADCLQRDTERNRT